MSKARGNKLPWDAFAAEVLAGRTRIDAAALIALVNEVNPTGRGRDAKETAARYALKARLESLLVARFSDALEVTEDPEHEGLVSLRHRTERTLACHAILDALDDDARSWVRRALDLGTSEPDSDAEPARPAPAARGPEEELDASDPEAALRAAVAAEEAFDFELAGQLYTRAFQEGRDARSARELVRFLVDALAADAEALALDPDLPAAARENPDVRVLLGIAAARSGDEARALGYLAQVKEARAAEALALVVRSALARDDTEAARLRLEEAQAISPYAPELRALAEDLAKRLEAQRAPHEAELARLLAEGRDVEATAQAEAILARWPASEDARRAARALAVRRHAEEGRRFLDEADAARRRGESATARELVQRALGTPLDDEARARARQAAVELEAEAQEREATRRVDEVVAPLRTPERHERARGLAAYAELDDALRARARAQVAQASLDWIEAMLGAGCRPRAAVDAALALERAAGPGTDPAAVLAALAPHERALESVPHARRLAESAREAAAEERRRHASSDLEAAESALGQGDAGESAKLLERAAREIGASDPLRTRADALRARLAALAERRLLEKRFERARASHHYAGAKLCADALVAGAEGAERARWAEIARAYADDLRRRQRVRVFELDGGAACSRGSYLFDYPPAVAACVDLRGGVVVLPMIAGEHVFVRSFAIETGRMVRAVHLVAPERLDEPRLELSGDSVLVMGGSNGVLELSQASGEPGRWSGLRDRRDMERRFSEAVQPVPGGRYLWVIHSGDRPEGSVHDLEGERPVREIANAERFHRLPGVVPPRVAVVRGAAGDLTVLSLHEPTGVQTARHEFPHDVWAVAPHPVGDGLIVAFDRALRGTGRDTLTWAELSPQGEHRRAEVIPGVHAYPRLAIACARDVRMAFVRFQSADDLHRELLALAPEEGAPAAAGCLRVAWRVPLGPRRVLVQDPEGRRAYVVGEHDGGVEVIPLGPEPPALPDRGPAHTMKLPLERLCACVQPPRKTPDLFMTHFKWAPVAEIRRLALAMRTAREGDLPALVDLFWGLSISDDAASAGELAAFLLERYPDDPHVRQIGWAGLAVERRWETLLSRLGPVDPASLPDDPARKHRHHLLAAAAIAVGDVARAARHLEEARALLGLCNLEPLGALAEALGGELPTDEVPRDLPSLRQLLALIRAADARLARGDHAGVIALFDRSITWELDEVQAFARLATAHLAQPASTEAERLAKSLGLARFSDLLYEPRVGFRREVLVPGATWTTERLDALAARADAWLAEDPR